MKKLFPVSFFVVFLFALAVNAQPNPKQQRKIDSLLKLLGTAKIADQPALMGQLSKKYFGAGDTAKAKEFIVKACDLAVNNGNDSICNGIFTQMTNFYRKVRQYDSADIFYEKKLDYFLRKKLYRFAGGLCLDQGIMHKTELRKYSRAMDCYLKALRYYEMSGLKLEAGYPLINIANVYSDQRQYELAEKNFIKAIEIFENNNGNKELLARVHNDFGINCQRKRNLETALEHFEAAIQYGRYGTNQLIFYSAIYNASGVYLDLLKSGKTEELYKTKTIAYLDTSMIFFTATNNLPGLASVNISYGLYYTLVGKLAEAKPFLDKGYTQAKQTGDPEMLMEATLALSEYYEKKGDLKNSLEYHKLYKAYADTVVNTETTERTANLVAEFESEKKDRQISELNFQKQKQQLVADEEKQKKGIILFSGIVIIAVISIFTFFMLNRFLVVRKQKKVIEEQKALVEEKQKEVLDSIYYARRIQRALITSEFYIEKKLKAMKGKA